MLGSQRRIMAPIQTSLATAASALATKASQNQAVIIAAWMPKLIQNKTA